MRGSQTIASAFNSLAVGFSLRPDRFFFVIFYILFSLWSLHLRSQSPENTPPNYTWLKRADLPDLTVAAVNTQDITIAIATDQEGNVYTLSFGSGVDKRNSEGVITVSNFISASQLDAPLDIAIDEEGYIYIADFLAEGDSYLDNGKIKVFSPQGNYLPERTILTSFYRPLGIDVDETKVYVAEFNDATTGPEQDQQLSRVRTYNKMNGNVVAETNNVEIPYRIAVNSGGQVYVSQAGNNDPAVLVFNNSLVLQGELPNISSPGSVVVDPFDFVHVIEYNNRIDFAEFINFEELGLGEIIDISGDIYRGQRNEEFVIKVFNSSQILVGTVVQNLDFPLDMAFNTCDRMFVDNAEIKGIQIPFGGPFIPSSMDFDLEIFTRTPSFDTEAPAITCPGDMEFSLPAGQTSMTVSFPSATVTDNCSATVSQTGGPASGSQLAAGTYEIEFTAEDGVGNTDSCTFTIVVEAQEAEASMVNCTANISTSADPDKCGAIVTFTAPTASEGGVALEVTRTAGPASGSLFPIGTTTVTFEATASDNNVLSCSFTITVSDDQAPEIICGGNIQRKAQPGQNSVVVQFQNPSVTDNCSVTLAQTKGPVSESEFPVGSTTIEFTATDPSGKTDTCTFLVIVEASDPPSFECRDEEDLPVLELDQNCDLESQSFIYLLENFQNFQNDPYIDQDQTREGDQLLVSLHVYDGEGGAFVKTCDFALQVVDTIKPNIDCPASPQTISPDSDGKYRLPDYRGRASDNCSGTLVVVQDPPAGEITANTTVTLEATDAAGNRSECTFQVVLQESEAPEFTCPAPDDLPVLEIGLYCEIDVPQYSGLLSDFENFEDEPFFVQSEERIGNILNVSIEVFDGEDGEFAGRCDFQIQLIDTFTPLIDCPTGTVNISANSDGKYILPSYSSLIFDNCVSSLEITQIPSPGEITEGGTVTLSATDASGNKAECQFEVVLLAAGAPGFTCPAQAEIPELPLDADCNYDLPDNLEDLLKDFRNFENSPLFETSFQQTGNSLQVQIKVYDGFQQEEYFVGECNFVIDLIDTTPPEAICVSEFTVQLDEEGSANITADQLDNGSSDTCGNITRSLSRTSFSTADVENSPIDVVLTVADAAGNSATCTTQVTVLPFEEELDPFSCVTSLTVPLNGMGEARLNIDQLYVGSLGPEGSISVDKDFFTCADIGEQTVYLTYSGNKEGTCPIIVTVVDNTPPAARPKNIEIALDRNGTARITAADLENGSTDNCTSALQIQINKTSFTCEDIGENQIDFTVRDSNTNSTTTDVTVTVTDPFEVCGGGPVEPPAEGRFVILFPNPGRGEVQIATSEGLELYRVEIFDMRGRFLDARELNLNSLTSSYHLDLRQYQTGVYTLKLYANGREYIRRAIITTY